MRLLELFSYLLTIVLFIITPWWIYFSFGAIVGFVFSPIIYLMDWGQLSQKIDESYQQFYKDVVDEGDDDLLADIELNPDEYRRGFQWRLLLLMYVVNGLFFTVLWPVAGMGFIRQEEPSQ